MPRQPPQRRDVTPEGVPPHVLAAAQAALDLHDPTLRVVPLVADSLLYAVELPSGADRRLVFEREDLWIDVTLWSAPAGHRLEVLVGRDLPDDAGEGSGTPVEGLDLMEIVQQDSRTKVAVSRGRAETAGVRPGLTSLAFPAPAEPASGGPAAGLRTAWVTL